MNDVLSAWQNMVKLPKIVFLGTPSFAVASLSALLNAGYPVVGVVTAPDKPAGRGMKLQGSPVKQFALEHQLPILQPLKLKDPVFLADLDALGADLFVVVAFRMLPELVWNRPKLGTINVHGSLLPNYRGAAPINWAIINGETETGVSTFQLSHKIDTGAILLQERLPIAPDENVGSVHDRMMQAGASLIVKTLQELQFGKIQPTEQAHLDESKLKHAPKLHTDTCEIPFHGSVADAHNLVRGLSPFPGAFTYMHGKMLKVYQTKVEEVQPEVAPGTFVSDKKTFLKLACKDGYLHLLHLQIEGKKKNDIADFLRGYRFPA